MTTVGVFAWFLYGRSIPDVAPIDLGETPTVVEESRAGVGHRTGSYAL
jgi:hypothetical protein